MREIMNFSYFGRAFKDPFGIADELVKLSDGVKFTSIVVTGISGASIAPFLSAALDVKFAIIRKESDNSHAMPYEDRPVFEGVITDRWLFVDDFIGTGATFRTVKSSVEIIARRGRLEDFQCVGSYQYEREIFTPLPLTNAVPALTPSAPTAERKCLCGCNMYLNNLPNPRWNLR